MPNTELQTARYEIERQAEVIASLESLAQSRVAELDALGGLLAEVQTALLVAGWHEDYLVKKVKAAARRWAPQQPETQNPKHETVSV